MLSRYKREDTRKSGVRCSLWFLIYGGIGFVVEARFMVKTRQLIFQVGKNKQVSRGYKINELNYPVQIYHQILGKDFKVNLNFNEEEEEFELTVNGIDFRNMPY